MLGRLARRPSQWGALQGDPKLFCSCCAVALDSMHFANAEARSSLHLSFDRSNNYNGFEGSKIERGPVFTVLSLDQLINGKTLALEVQSIDRWYRCAATSEVRSRFRYDDFVWP